MFLIMFVLISDCNDNYLRRFGSDVGYLVSSPSRWEMDDYLKLTGVSLTAGVFFLLDEDVRENTSDNKHFVNRVADVCGSLGGGYGVGLLGCGYLIGHVFDNDNIKHLSIRSTESAIISVGATYMIKILTGRKRPYMNEGPYEFSGPSIESGTWSMPSAHTSFAFSVASYLTSETKNPWIGIISYSIAAMVGYSRINKDKHWSSDVFIGAVIGTTVGITISHID